MTVIDTEDDPEEDAVGVVEAVNDVLLLVDDDTDPVCDEDIFAEALVQALVDGVGTALVDEDIVPVELVDTDAQ